MRLTLALFAMAALLPEGVAAQSASDRAALDSVDRYVRAELERQRIPGMSVAVLRGDSILLARGYGFANLEHRVPATDSTIYQSGSVGKQFTSAAIVTLAREGKLGLDDPIRKYLPEAPSGWASITVRHLLTHTSGVPDYTADLVDFRRDYTEEALAKLYTRQPLDFQPGATWSYSNTGYALLGFIVRRVTGRFYGDYLKERVFEPLGMRTARVISERDIVPNRAAGYELVDGEIKNQGWVSPSLNTTADGSLYITVNDMARWAIGLNHARVPDGVGLAQSWTPVRLNDGGTYPYGFGWRLDDQRGHSRIGHGPAGDRGGGDRRCQSRRRNWHCLRRPDRFGADRGDPQQSWAAGGQRILAGHLYRLVHHHCGDLRPAAELPVVGMNAAGVAAALRPSIDDT